MAQFHGATRDGQRQLVQDARSRGKQAQASSNAVARGWKWSLRQTFDRPSPVDLDCIVLMALRKEPERRYSTAEQFAADLRLYLAGRPILAAPDSALNRGRKFVARNRVAVGAAVGFLAALAGGVGATAWQARVATQQRNHAQHEFNAVRSLAGSVLGRATTPAP